MMVVSWGDAPDPVPLPPVGKGLEVRAVYQPRRAIRASCGSLPISRPLIASPMPLETSAMISGIPEVRGGLDDRLGAPRRVAALEDTAADEDAIRAELHHERGVGRGRDAARAEEHHRQLPVLRDLAHEIVRRAEFLAIVICSSGGATVRRRIASVIARRWRTASTMLPVPGSPFERIIAAPSPIRRSASPRSRAPQTNGTL